LPWEGARKWRLNYEVTDIGPHLLKLLENVTGVRFQKTGVHFSVQKTQKELMKPKQTIQTNENHTADMMQGHPVTDNGSS